MAQSQTKTTTESANKRPLAEQMPFLTDAWKQSQGLLTTNQNNGYYTGPQVAQVNPQQLNTFQGMLDYAKNSGAPQFSSNMANTLSGMGTSMGAMGSAFNNTAQGIQNTGQGIIGSGSNLAASGAGSTFGSINDLKGFRPAGGADTNIADASKYADNPFMSGMVDATMRDARRQVSEQALPQIARNSALGHNIGSSKSGISEGLVERGLAEKTADVSAGLRGDAYGRGLQMAESGRQFNNNALLDATRSGGALGAQMAGTGVSQIGAGAGVTNSGTSAGQLGLGYQGLGLDANKAALGAMDLSNTQQGGLFDLAMRGGEGQRLADQYGIDDALKRDQYGRNAPWQDLMNYWNIVGANNWGGTSTGTSTEKQTSSNPLGTIAGIGSGLTGLFGTGGLNMLAPMGAKMFA